MSITLQIPPFTTEANRIPLGSKPNMGLQINNKHHELQPSFAKGLLKPARVEESAQYKQSKCTEREIRKSMVKPVNRKEVPKTGNPNAEHINISASDAATELRNYCVKHGLFAKWEGTGQTPTEIANWWRNEFRSQLSITTLGNNFIYIECYIESLKSRLLIGDYVFDKGLNFKFLDWRPKFDENKYFFNTSSKWILIRSLPIELMHVKILMDIGNKLGKFISLERNWSDRSDIKILIEVSKNIKKLKNLSINTVDNMYNITPEWFSGEVSEDLYCYGNINPRSKKPQTRITTKQKQDNGIKIQFNEDIGGFTISEVEKGKKQGSIANIHNGNSPDNAKIIMKNPEDGSKERI
ncbi:hypothetical protein SUGI_0132590 [Cryptomeria japonica]|nr:hypothetical protein SUGI_0132590 [Cryptomeria japonica]